MWGNKKAETDAPLLAVPVSPKAPDKNPNKPSSASLEGMGMSSEAGRPLTTTAAGATARLGPSLQIKGEISGHEDLHVDGSVEGLIQLDDRKLTVGTSAKVTADIVAREIVVYGSIKGNLRARDRIEIKKDGSVVGDLTTARIMIEDGAYFKGAIEIDRKAAEGGGLEKTAYPRSVPAPVQTAKVAS
jgi:cytoskeletal protein CcmA (bactofilin family)